MLSLLRFQNLPMGFFGLLLLFSRWDRFFAIFPRHSCDRFRRRHLPCRYSNRITKHWYIAIKISIRITIRWVMRTIHSCRCIHKLQWQLPQIVLEFPITGSSLPVISIDSIFICNSLHSCQFTSTFSFKTSHCVCNAGKTFYKNINVSILSRGYTGHFLLAIF